jgi:hypothetical protein
MLPGVDVDPKSGKFLPGNQGGPGRPPGIHLRAVVHSREPDPVGVVYRVWLAVVNKALDGDVPAARLVLEHMCDREIQPPVVVANLTANMQVNQVPSGQGPPLPDAESFASYMQKLGETIQALRERRPQMTVVEPPPGEIA